MGRRDRIFGALRRRLGRAEAAPAPTRPAERRSAEAFDDSGWADLDVAWRDLLDEAGRAAEEAWSGLVAELESEGGDGAALALARGPAAAAIAGLRPSPEASLARWREGAAAASRRGDLAEALALLQAQISALAEGAGAAWRVAIVSGGGGDALDAIAVGLASDLIAASERFCDDLGRLIAVEDVEDDLIDAGRRWRGALVDAVERRGGDWLDQALA